MSDTKSYLPNLPNPILGGGLRIPAFVGSAGVAAYNNKPKKQGYIEGGVKYNADGKRSKRQPQTDPKKIAANNKAKARAATIKQIVINSNPGFYKVNRAQYDNPKPLPAYRPPRSDRQIANAKRLKDLGAQFQDPNTAGGKAKGGSWKDFIKANSKGNPESKQKKAAAEARRAQYPAYYAYLAEKRLRKIIRDRNKKPQIAYSFEG